MKKLMREFYGAWLFMLVVVFACVLFAASVSFSVVPILLAVTYSGWYGFILVFTLPITGVLYARLFACQKLDDLANYAIGFFKQGE